MSFTPTRPHLFSRVQTFEMWTSLSRLTLTWGRHGEEHEIDKFAGETRSGVGQIKRRSDLNVIWILDFSGSGVPETGHFQLFSNRKKSYLTTKNNFWHEILDNLGLKRLTWLINILFQPSVMSLVRFYAYNCLISPQLYSVVNSNKINNKNNSVLLLVLLTLNIYGDLSVIITPVSLHYVLRVATPTNRRPL